MMKIWTDHAIKRISGRLNGVVLQEDVTRVNSFVKTNFAKIVDQKIYLFIRKFDRELHLEDHENDDINGDVLVAVLKGGRVASIMIGKSYRRDYFSDGKIIKIGD